ncbi:threonine/serine exporter family protein [Amycolatopsis alkalitolerans]|uniref:Threonine/serine exporter family protein n=1 Tax=Amycolatopsis alkalitolerans TaxID=2547244 RepID=A0A5C4M4E0_9PSEU|nr:threonine/serine exporter family protein [Amycolatopsis alkalitolerans]TNC28019.1 threonine/serine exporter family protein [Amycolatopsis alkalitolerans]
MKGNQRARGPVTRRRGWHILEAPRDPNVDRENRRKRSTEPRRRAWHILEAPTGEQPAPEPGADYGPALPDDATVNFVLDLTLRIGEVQMASGAGASDVTATILALTSALGMPHCEVDVIFTSITVTCHRGTDMAPVSAVRVVRSRSLDYTRLSETELLVRQITRGRTSAEEAYAALHRITGAPHPYPRWVATLAWGGMAFFITLLIGGTLDLAVGALVISSLVDRLGRLLNKYALPFFFQQAVGGLVATGLATLTVKTGLVPTSFSTLVASAAITVLLSGLSTVSAVQDAITGYNVTAAGRTMETALMSAGLITGVAFALNLAKSFGFPQVEPELPTQTVLTLPVMIVAGAGTAACFALGSYSKLRPLLVAATAGAIGAGVYGGLVLATFDVITASGVAATLVGFCGGVLSRRLKVTPLVVAVSGITPLLPGLSTYRGLYELATQGNGNVSTLMKAVTIGLALAAGVVLGEYLAQPVRTGLGRLERRLAGPRLAGPLRASDGRLE